MRQKATVERLLNDGTAVLLVRRQSACSGDCHSCGGCGGTAQTLRLTARDPIGTHEGDRVYVESDGKTVLKGAALVYLLPLALFLLGYVSALPLGAWAFAVGCGGFALGLLPAVWYDRQLKKHPPAYVIVGFVE